MIRKLLLLGLVLVVLAGAGFWWFVLRDDAPPPAALESCDDGLGDTPTQTDGRWRVSRADGVYVGYRIDEQFGGDTLSRTVAGRTPLVSGELVMEDGTLTEARVEGDLSGLVSDEPRRDDYLADHALFTDDTPMATFTLTESIALPDEVPPGEGVSVDADGTLEVHGVTQGVTIALDVCATGEGIIEVAGSLPIVLADYDIETPDVPGLVRVEDHGTMELHLVFTSG